LRIGNCCELCETFVFFVVKKINTMKKIINIPKSIFFRKASFLICIGILIIYIVLKSPPHPPPPPPPPEKICKVLKIVSVEYYLSDIFDYQNDRIFPFTDQKMIVIAKAKVLAGFNLLDGDTRIRVDTEEEPVQEAGVTKSIVKNISVTLPPPEIISIEPSYKYYDISGNPPIEIHNWLLAQAKVRLKNMAVQMGILEKAEESAKNLIEEVFADFKVKVYFSSESGKILSSPSADSETLKP